MMIPSRHLVPFQSVRFLRFPLDPFQGVRSRWPGFGASLARNASQPGLELHLTEGDDREHHDPVDGRPTEVELQVNHMLMIMYGLANTLMKRPWKLNARIREAPDAEQS